MTVIVNEQPTEVVITDDGDTPVTITQGRTDVDIFEGIPLSGGGDKNYTQNFTASAFVTVLHNLGKKPSVTVINSAGDNVRGEVDYISNNMLTLSFNSPFTGTAILN